MLSLMMGTPRSAAAAQARPVLARLATLALAASRLRCSPFDLAPPVGLIPAASRDGRVAQLEA